MRSWKPISTSFVLVLSVIFGLGTMYGTDVVIGTTVSGHISMDTTWDLAGSPYIVMNDVVVDPGVTLTIEPGVEVKFDPAGPPPSGHPSLSIFVEGTLLSIGDSSLPVEFTSNGVTPQTRDWQKIQINSSGNAEISHARIFYSDQGVYILSSNNIVTNNFMSKNNGALTLEPPSSDNYIANNTAKDNVGGFLGMGASSNNIVKNNTISNSPWPMIGYDSWGNVIVGNTIINSSYAIQFFWSANNNTIEDNTIRNASLNAILLDGDGYNVVENNTISFCRYGIEIHNEGHNTLSNNTVTGCQRGVYVGLQTNYNVIVDNNVSENIQGVYVGYAHYSTFARNNFVFNSEFGLKMRNSTRNLVYHNNFIDNGIQALDTHRENSWDNGYPSGGNYWSDYSGNDSFRGPNQDVPGSDGIGDSPYPINPNGTDRYPLIELATGNLPPRDVNAYLSGDNYENTTVTWNLSWNDGQRANDVTGYEIFRSSTYDKNRVGYELRGSTANRTTEFIDSYSGEGDPNRYFYYVCAINGTGNISCNGNQVGKFTRPLTKGWNLVSIPLETMSLRTAYVFKTAPFEIIRYYDVSDQNDHWKEFTSFKGYNDLPDVDPIMGLWVKSTTDGNLTIAGRVPEETVIPLKQGWNLVGYPCLSTTAVRDIQTDSLIANVEGFDSGETPYFLIQMIGDDHLLPGHGYWFEASGESFIGFAN